MDTTQSTVSGISSGGSVSTSVGAGTQNLSEAPIVAAPEAKRS